MEFVDFEAEVVGGTDKLELDYEEGDADKNVLGNS